MDLLLQSGQPDGALLKGELFRMEKYADLVLTYQRLGSDTTDLVLKACDLDTVIRAAVKEYARLFILKKLILSFTPTGLTVLTDKKWLDYMQPGFDWLVKIHPFLYSTGGSVLYPAKNQGTLDLLINKEVDMIPAWAAPIASPGRRSRAICGMPKCMSASWRMTRPRASWRRSNPAPASSAGS